MKSLHKGALVFNIIIVSSFWAFEDICEEHVVSPKK